MIFFEHAVPAFTTNISFSFQTHGTCLCPHSTRSTPHRLSSSSTSPESTSISSSRPVIGTGIRWWWSAKTLRSDSLKLELRSMLSLELNLSAIQPYLSLPICPSSTSGWDESTPTTVTPSREQHGYLVLKISSNSR